MLDAAGSFSTRSIGSVVVLIWHTQVTIEGARTLAKIFQELRRTRPHEKYGFVTLLEDDVDIRPPAPARAAVAEVLREYNDDIGAAAVVYEAAGFRSTIVRSVITAINLAGGARFPNRVFSNRKVAVEWLSTELDDPSVPRAVLTAISRMRRGTLDVGGVTRKR